MSLVKMSHSELGQAINLITAVLTQHGLVKPHREGNAMMQPKTAELEDRQGINSSLELSEGSNPIDTMIFNFYTPKLRENKFLLF